MTKEKLNRIRNNLECIIGVFEGYCEYHKNKGDRESLLKAQANNTHAAKLREALKLLDEWEEMGREEVAQAEKDYMSALNYLNHVQRDPAYDGEIEEAYKVVDNARKSRGNAKAIKTIKSIEDLKQSKNQ